MMLDWITTGVFVTILLVAAVLDVRTNRIPNALTLGGLISGLLLRAWGGADALAHGVLGAGLALLVALPFFAVRALGKRGNYASKGTGKNTDFFGIRVEQN
jgi:Flp pilus assembly protein protease CpaA